MKLGWIGLGKLGLPLAVMLGQTHEIVGYDINPNLRKKRKYEHRELGPTGKDDFQRWFDKANITFAETMRDVAGCEIVFVAVQTPHAPEFEGITPLPVEREDFNYEPLKQAITELTRYTEPHQIIVVVSTVLPGTMRREILPIIKGNAKLVYNPAFPAMGTTCGDIAPPEFVLLGGNEVRPLDKMQELWEDFYAMTNGVPIKRMSIESAELAKVAYNLFISTKIAVANTLMEVCHKTPGCDIDDVTGVLKAATKRLLSPAYLEGGQGDGGGCHPRDGIAMSWLARKLDISFDLFGLVMRGREYQAGFLVDLCQHAFESHHKAVVVLGKAYKPETNLTTGSASLLCLHLLNERGLPCYAIDPHTDPDFLIPGDPCVFLIGTKHTVFRGMTFPKGSVVIDPFRFVPEQSGVRIVPVGVGK